MRSRFLTSPLALILLIFSVYAPFMGSRFIRTAGDEKVYVSQAVEMERAGHWFVQSLQDEPNYYKGPLHYVLLRAGFKVFGRTPWATLYMNLGFLIAGALALGAIIRRHYPEWVGGDLWIGSAFALGTGIYAHSFASQMEVELASLFAIGLFLLDRVKKDEAGWLFWILAGVIGWAKSPLHSAFLGSTAVLYWTARGELLTRLRNPKAWAAVLTGIAVSISGYLPAYFMDRENFWNAYVIRETLKKSDGSGQGWSVAILSTFGFYLFPWLLLALVAYAQTLAQLPRLIRDPRNRSLLALGFAAFLPSAVFFCWHVYRFENYNLPVIAGVWLWIAVVWANSNLFWKRIYSAALILTGILFLLIPIFLTVLAVHFSPLPAWWPSWLLPLVWVGSLISALGFLFMRKPHLLALSSGGFLWALGALFVVIGEREMTGLKSYLAEARAQNRSVELGYYNLNRNIWSEWGFLGFWVGHEVHGIHTPEKLREAIVNGETILVSAKENGVQDFRDFVQKNFPETKLNYIPWKRWRTRGQSDSGKPLWQEAWEKRDLSLLEVDYFVVQTQH